MGRARWALVVGVAVVAIAAGSGARADVRPINLDGCPGSCVPVAIGEQAVAEDDAAASITLSRFGGDADDPNSALIFDRKAMPAALADGLPSALASASAEAPGARGVSPYDFFADVIDVPHSADARAFTAVSFSSSPPRSPASSEQRSVGQQRLFWAAVPRYSLPSRLPPLRLAASLTAGGRCERG